MRKMSTTETRPHVISIRVSDTEKRELDALAEKKKRKPTAIVWKYFRSSLKKDMTNQGSFYKKMLELRKKSEAIGTTNRHPNDIDIQIREFRGDE